MCKGSSPSVCLKIMVDTNSLTAWKDGQGKVAELVDAYRV